MTWWHWALIIFAIILLIWILVKTGIDPTAVFDDFDDFGGGDGGAD